MVKQVLKKNKKNIRMFILLIFVASIILRLGALTIKQDMWHDTSFTYLFSQKDIDYITDSNDVHPPLYYMIMKLFILISTNEIWLRTTSIFFFIGFFYYTDKFLKKYQDEFTRLITLTIISVSPTIIYYSIEPRNYMLGLFLIMGQLYYYGKILYKYKTKDEILFMIFSLLMIYTHYYTGILLIFEFLYMYFKYNERVLKKFIGVYITLSIMTIPLIIYLVKTIPKIHSFWFDKITFTSLYSTIIYQFFSPDWSTPFTIILFTFFLSTILITNIFIRTESFYWLIFFFPVGLLFIISQFIPMYHHRFFVFYSIGLYIIIAKTISNLDRKKITRWLSYILLFILILCLFLVNINLINVLPKELRESSDALKKVMDKNQLYTIVHTSPFSSTPYKYYMREYRVRNLLVTRLNEFERFTAGGSVIEDWEIINPDIDGSRYCIDKCYFVKESNKYIPKEEHEIIYNEGGLVVYGTNQKSFYPND